MSPGYRGYHEAHYRVKLYCGHAVTYPAPAPAAGDLVWCARCDTSETVADSRPADLQQEPERGP